MNIALLAAAARSPFLNSLWRRCMPAGAGSTPRPADNSAVMPMAGEAPGGRGAHTWPAASRAHCEPAALRPLRVVRVVEAGQTRSQVGRMVISGRLADVCAELDRLAARETAGLH